VADFDNWAAPSTRDYIIAKLASGSIDCPVPLTADNATFAARVMQFVADVPINSTCCQQNGYCGAQYSTDVKFLWGLPKPAPNTSSAAAAAVAAAGAVPEAADDGGCDLLAGYVPQHLLERAARAAAASGSSNEPLLGGWDGGALALPAAVAAHLPEPHKRRLATALAARAGSPHLAAAASDADALLAAVAPPWSSLPLIPCHVMTSRLRVQLTPLRNQSDFIDSMEHTQAAVGQLQGLLPTVDLRVYGITAPGPQAPGSPGAFSDNQHTQWLPRVDSSGAAFMYSLTFVYYDQYRYIGGTAVTLVAVAVAAVFAAGLLVTHPAVAATTGVLVASVAIDVVGAVWALNPTHPDPFGAGPWGVDVNAVSVVNLAMAVGLSVEFCVHVASAFTAAVGTRQQRVAAAMETMGASVFTGITLTKLVGVAVLAWAPSQLFRLYYFRMYASLIVVGAAHGLLVLPVFLSLAGWESEGGGGGKARRRRASPA
jgi:hypothetical protein